MERLPAARAAALGRKRGMRCEQPLDCLDIADKQRRVEVRARDPRMQCEQPFGAIGSPVGCRLDELLHGGAELERQFLDPVA